MFLSDWSNFSLPQLLITLLLNEIFHCILIRDYFCSSKTFFRYIHNSIHLQQPDILDFRKTKISTMTIIFSLYRSTKYYDLGHNFSRFIRINFDINTRGYD